MNKIEFKNVNIECNDYNIYINKLLNKKINVDLILTDPPYNLSKKNNFHTMGRTGISFGSWDYNFNQTEGINKIGILIRAGGSIIIFNAWRNMGKIAAALEKNNFIIKDLIRGIKNNPMPRNINRRYVTDYELAIWAIKKGKGTFNKPDNKKYLRPEFKESIVIGNRLHPTQKPVPLLESLIKTHSNEGDIILDPFMGSGSTGIAAMNLNRVFYGCEIDINYFNKAKEWIGNNRFKIKPIFML